MGSVGSIVQLYLFTKIKGTADSVCVNDYSDLMGLRKKKLWAMSTLYVNVHVSRDESASSAS